MTVSLRKVSLPACFSFYHHLLIHALGALSLFPFSSLLVLGMFCLQKKLMPCISSIGVIKYHMQDKFLVEKFEFMVPEGEFIVMREA